MMKNKTIAFFAAALAAGVYGNEIKLEGWEPTTPGCSLKPGCGMDGGTALGMDGVLEKHNRYYTWKSAPVKFKPNGVYGMEFYVKRKVSGSEVLCNASFHNLLLNSGGLYGWKKIRTIMRVPVKGATSRISLSDYNCQGETLFDRMRLVELEPRYRTESGITLGRGEVICGNRYYHVTQERCPGGSDTRALDNYIFGSTGDKFMLWRGGEVLHRFNVAGRRFLNARCMLHLSDIVNCKLEIAASRDGSEWTKLAILTNAEPCDITFPADLFPADEILLRMKRLSVNAKHSMCRIKGLQLDGEIDGDPVYLAGATTYVEKETGAVFESMDTHKYRVAKPGALLPGTVGDLSVWGVSSGFKIFRDTAVPTDRTDALRLKAAANESESVQLVITPKRDIQDLRVEAGPLKLKGSAAGGTEIPASAVNVLRVGYVDVRIVMDKVGQGGLWPDPLIPQDGSLLPVRAGENQPMWITVKVPKGTPKGVYCGDLTVKVDGNGLTVPFEVEVFGFEMPDRMTLQAPFALGYYMLYRYHNVKKNEEERFRIRELYTKTLLEHHVTPFYWGNPFEPKVWRIRNLDNPEKTAVDIDFSRFDRETEMIIDKYHGNVLKITPDGLGGGNQHNRRPAEIRGVKRGDPRYERIMELYLGQYVEHLRKKGWLKYEFVFWFDEPYGRDFDFVSKGMATVKKYAPELPRMITCGFSEKLMDAVNLWCPVVQSLHLPMEKACRARGDGVWWYICCSPRDAPIGEHIDHPGTDMRVWSWQNWGKNVTGSLVWTVNWWTAPGKYPDPGKPQDPYLDPMSWGKTYNPKRVAAVWCNGDGRYVYPPLASRDKGRSEAIFDEPVVSYRLAMFRDGSEDYEYFTILKRLDPSNPLLSVPESVYRDVWNYTHDPASMETHREKLAREIERLDMKNERK